MPAAAARVAARSSSSSPVHWTDKWQGSPAFQSPPCFKRSSLLLTDTELDSFPPARYSRRILRGALPGVRTRSVSFKGKCVISHQGRSPRVKKLDSTLRAYRIVCSEVLYKRRYMSFTQNRDSSESFLFSETHNVLSQMHVLATPLWSV